MYKESVGDGSQHSNHYFNICTCNSRMGSAVIPWMELSHSGEPTGPTDEKRKEHKIYIAQVGKSRGAQVITRSWVQAKRLPYFFVSFP